MKDGIPRYHGRLTLTILLLLGFMVGFPPSAVFGEVKTITYTVKQPFGGSQSPDDASIAAIARAKREALEMAGSYVQALTVVKDLRVEKDEILAITAGVVKAEIVSEKNYHTEDAFGIEVTVKTEVDMALLEGSVRKLLEDRTHLGPAQGQPRQGEGASRQAGPSRRREQAAAYVGERLTHFC